ncbi:hypothetical protein [Paraburkholderia caballeronis]|uniref:Uncharacterized protein n=1 Tax=Paraburkholderia caballeronis TaxID=416943 RepID=A0A1H7L608_9BURK|nr:hypothetical protein [Paraburkholderia caballeronis]PXW28303.1 hypothetical protein C7403_102195 [Paraburkholderia caballeronis]PXX03669.1 hypothetical protein C7407_102195 [Paraburkholderia caballeronis]RAK04413.1 hypothetical protein C7409_102195 [Paraburkholderia caballeronis]SED81178.1 hypothetical protein SAMN05445871_3982 [Paraburkholderia caballeronis]SEK94240.1 hypothetical protein SAMN05192542_104195 [Paraburkholderia caballeronis]
MEQRDERGVMFGFDADTDSTDPTGSHGAGTAGCSALVCALVIALCLWCFAALPFEIDGMAPTMRLFALLLSKCLWITAGIGALVRVRGAVQILRAMCMLDVAAVAPAFAFEYRTSFVLFGLSLFDCVLKASLFVSLIVRRERTETEPRQ